MGEAKLRQYSRQQFLIQHRFCAYCGDWATTTDHCPPRCFFDRRQWPETYEFPACGPCNEQARRDEQALAVLARIQLLEEGGEPAQTEWVELYRGVVNNQPEIAAEWLNSTPTQLKRFFRDNFGSEGDRLRWAGFGAIKLGPLTRAAIDRFSVKLGQALYYRHNGNQLFEGDVYVRHINPFLRRNLPEQWESVLQFAPQLARPQRNTKSLADRFIYRFDHNADIGVMYAVVQFGDQLVLQIMAVRHDLAKEMEAERAAAGEEFSERRLSLLPKTAGAESSVGASNYPRAPAQAPSSTGPLLRREQTDARPWSPSGGL